MSRYLGLKEIFLLGSLFKKDLNRPFGKIQYLGYWEERPVVISGFFLNRKTLYILFDNETKGKSNVRITGKQNCQGKKNL